MKQGKIKIEQANNPENMVMIDSLNFYRFLPKIEIEGVYKNRTTKRTFGEDKNQQIEVVVSKHFLRKGELWEEETVKDSVKIVSYEKDLYIIFKAIATNPDVTGFLDIFVSTLPDAEKYATETIRYQTATDFSGYPFSVFNGTFDRYYQNGNRLIFNESNFKEGNGVAYFHIGFHFSREPKKDFYIDFFAYDYDADIFRPDKERFHRMKIKVSVLNIATYHIYHDGRIEKHIPKNIQQNNQYKYVYHDEKGGVHEIGVFNFKTIKNKYGSGYGGKEIDLIDIRELKNYNNGNVKFKLQINTVRYYINSLTLASLLGAMLLCGYEDFVFNGFSHSDGSSFPSVSHKNGYNGDLRYLRKDKLGGKTDLFQKNGIGWEGLDEERQNNFNDALYLFGWKSMLSQYYGDNKNKLLNHCDDDKNKKHNDHLHIQGYNPKYKELNF